MKILLLIVMLMISTGCATMKKFAAAYGDETRKEEARKTNCTSYVNGNMVNTHCN